MLPEAGFNLFSLRIPVAGQVVDVIDAAAGFAETGENPTHSGIPLLFPYPNRIRAGRYSWDGREYTLADVHRDALGNAIHGLVFDRPWQVVSQADDCVVGRFQLSVDAPERRALWPADFIFEVQYALRAGGLRCDLRIENPDREALPWGFGTHSYFRVPLAAMSERGQCLVQAPAASQWELADFLPTGNKLPVAGRLDLREGQELADLRVDNVYTDVTPRGGVVQSIVMDPAAGLQMMQSTDSIFSELVAYTPPHGRSVCLEPYTCVTDAVNLAARGVECGWRVLPPGAEFRTWFEIAVSPIYV